MSFGHLTLKFSSTPTSHWNLDLNSLQSVGGSLYVKVTLWEFNTNQTKCDDAIYFEWNGGTKSLIENQLMCKLSGWMPCQYIKQKCQAINKFAWMPWNLLLSSFTVTEPKWHANLRKQARVVVLYRKVGVTEFFQNMSNDSKPLLEY